MPPAVLTFAASPSLREQAAERWLVPALSVWPDRVPPGVEHLGEIDDLLRAAPQPAGNTHHHPAPRSPALVILDGQNLGLLFRIADALRQQLRPAIFLLPDPSVVRSRLRGHGIILDSWEASPSCIAAMLFALRERQGAIDELANDLHVAQVVSGGMQSEMDRMHEELQLASAVQRQFLPSRLPEIGGVACGVIYRPVGYVSGDIYDVRKIGEHHWGFFVADAVGHGVPAALLTIVLSRALTTHEERDGKTHPIDPVRVISHLNTELCAQPEGPYRYATAVYALLDTRTRQLTVAGAGHPPPLLISGEGVDKLETDGPLLGVFADAPYNQVSMTLKPGQALLLHTDGLEVVFPDHDPARQKLGVPTRNYLHHLAHVVHDDAHDGVIDIAGVVRDLTELLDQQAGSLHRADDVTALLMTPLPLAGESGKAPESLAA